MPLILALLKLISSTDTNGPAGSVPVILVLLEMSNVRREGSSDSAAGRVPLMPGPRIGPTSSTLRLLANATVSGNVPESECRLSVSSPSDGMVKISAGIVPVSAVDEPGHSGLSPIKLGPPSDAGLYWSSTPTVEHSTPPHSEPYAHGFVPENQLAWLAADQLWPLVAS